MKRNAISDTPMLLSALAFIGIAAVAKPAPRSVEVTPLRILPITPRSAMVQDDEAPSRMVFSPDGKTLATGGENCLLQFWNPQAGREKQVLRRRFDSTYDLAFSPDGSLFAIGTSDLVGVSLWGVRSGQLVRTLKEPYPMSKGADVFDCAFSPDGRTLAATACGEIQLWDVATGRLIRHLKGSKCQRHLVFSPDGKTLASAMYLPSQGSFFNRASVQLWDVQSGRPKRSLPRVGESIAFSRDGRHLITRLFAQNYQSSMACWNVSNGSLKWRASEKITANGDANPIALSPDGRLLATGHADGTLRLRDARSGRLIQSLYGGKGMILSVAFSPDSSMLASANMKAQVHLWSVRRIN